MQINIRFSSLRLILILFLCGTTVVLLENYNLSHDQSLPGSCLGILIGVGLAVVLFLPSVILKIKYNYDISDVLNAGSKPVRIAGATVFSAYLIYTAEYFLLKYTDMFTKKYYTDTSEWFVAFLLLSVCAYAAYRGANTITRFALFLFGFALVVYALIFGGAVGEIKPEGFDFGISMEGLLQDSLFFATASFGAVIFSCTSGYTERFKLRHILITAGCLAAFFAAVVCFERLALGSYGSQQEYQMFLLSKIQRLGDIKGVEALYMAVATVSVFCLISLSLCGINRVSGESKVLKSTLIFSAIIFVLSLCAASFISVREILSSVLFFDIFTVLVILFALALIVFFALGKGKSNDCKTA